jgi:hypothetical protein
MKTIAVYNTIAYKAVLNQDKIPPEKIVIGIISIKTLRIDGTINPDERKLISIFDFL